MQEKAHYKLMIDPEFQSLAGPLSPGAYRQLQDSLLQDGCQEAIVIWNKIIIDGYHRYQICSKHKIPFGVAEQKFLCRSAAIAWACEKHLKSRQLTCATRKYLIGLQYRSEVAAGRFQVCPGTAFTHMESMSQDRQIAVSSENTCVPYGYVIADRIALEHNISNGTVRRYATFAGNIERLKKKAPELAAALLAGQYRFTHKNLTALANLAPAELDRLYQYANQAHPGTALHPMISFVKQKERHTKARVRRTERSILPPLRPTQDICSQRACIPRLL